MFRVELHKNIELILSVFYRIGFWHRGDEETVSERRVKLFYSFYSFLMFILLMWGVLASGTKDEFVFSVETTLIGVVTEVKLFYIIWRKKEILELLNRICVYSIDDHEKFNQVNDKLNKLMNFVAVFVIMVFCCGYCGTLLAPLLGHEKKLLLIIGFPLDYKNDKFAFWLAVTLTFIGMHIFATAICLSPIVWYLMVNCGLRHSALGEQIKKMGERKLVEETTETLKVSNTERDNLYLCDLHEAIASHKCLEEYEMLQQELLNFY